MYMVGVDFINDFEWLERRLCERLGALVCSVRDGFCSLPCLVLSKCTQIALRRPNNLARCLEKYDTATIVKIDVVQRASYSAALINSLEL